METRVQPSTPDSEATKEAPAEGPCGLAEECCRLAMIIRDYAQICEHTSREIRQLREENKSLRQSRDNWAAKAVNALMQASQRCSVEESSRPRGPHKPEIVGANPTAAIKFDNAYGKKRRWEAKGGPSNWGLGVAEDIVALERAVRELQVICIPKSHDAQPGAKAQLPTPDHAGSRDHSRDGTDKPAPPPVMGTGFTPSLHDKPSEGSVQPEGTKPPVYAVDTDLRNNLRACRERNIELVVLAERLRITQEEREAIAACAQAAANCNGFCGGPALYKGDRIAATLRGLLERTQQ